MGKDSRQNRIKNERAKKNAAKADRMSNPSGFGKYALRVKRREQRSNEEAARAREMERAASRSIKPALSRQQIDDVASRPMSREAWYNGPRRGW